VVSRIFEKQWPLKPSAMATVAERRYADARALLATEKNAHANGAAYLAGFVVEILLKARLIAKFPRIAMKRPHEVTPHDRDVWLLIWRRHDLEAMLGRLSDVESALKKRGQRDGYDYLSDLKKVCAIWTIQARYSTRTISRGEARQVVDRVERIKELLK